MKSEKLNGIPSGTDLVLTEDLSYHPVTLMPRDKRESNIYYLSRLHEIGDIYIYFIVAAALSVPEHAVRYFNQRDITYYGFLLILSTLVTTRIVAYCMRASNWSVFGQHLLAVYFILMLLMTADGFI